MTRKPAWPAHGLVAVVLAALAGPPERSRDSLMPTSNEVSPEVDLQRTGWPESVRALGIFGLSWVCLFVVLGVLTGDAVVWCMGVPGLLVGVPASIVWACLRRRTPGARDDEWVRLSARCVRGEDLRYVAGTDVTDVVGGPRFRRFLPMYVFAAGLLVGLPRVDPPEWWRVAFGVVGAALMAAWVALVFSREGWFGRPRRTARHRASPGAEATPAGDAALVPRWVYHAWRNHVLSTAALRLFVAVALAVPTLLVIAQVAHGGATFAEAVWRWPRAALAVTCLASPLALLGLVAWPYARWKLSQWERIPANLSRAPRV